MALSEPKGGYFLDLIVEVGNNGTFVPVGNLHLSEALDPLIFFQQIELTFDKMAGDAIRIRGTAGGTDEFTSIVELEAYGMLDLLPGDANLDSLVSAGDLGILAGNFGLEQGATWSMGDFNGDGRVSAGDLGMLASHWGQSQATAIPEPAFLTFLSLSLLPVLRKSPKASRHLPSDRRRNSIFGKR